jgi:peroxiredoxin
MSNKTTIMKYFLFLITLFAISTCAMAQIQRGRDEKNFAIIRGHLKNDNSFEIFKPGFLGGSFISVPVDKNGDFFLKINVEGSATDIYLKLNGVMLFVQKNDTININLDMKENTISVLANDPQRDQELNTLVELNKLYWEKYINLQEQLNTDITDSVKFSLINNLYNKEIEFLLDKPVGKNTEKMLADIYFKYCINMFSNGLLNKYDLIANTPKSSHFALLAQKTVYRTEDETLFKCSSAYRDFVLRYISYIKPFNSWHIDGPKSAYEHKTVKFAPAWSKYNGGLPAFHIKEMRDWFLANSIIESSRSYDYDEVQAVYADFTTRVETPFYADSLKRYYAQFSKLKPGRMAPAFRLKNEKGEWVSLSMFKGKVVFVDFWGTGCGPCIDAIKNFAPALHAHYKKKDVAFISICLDAETPQWKEAIKKLNMQHHGVNLIAINASRKSVKRAYEIGPIPRYYLIDRSGRIANNVSPGPDSINELYPQIDKLLGNIK